MKCSQYQELISKLIDNEISTEDDKKLRSHLNKCQQCLSFYTKAKKVNMIVKKTTVPEIKKPEIAYQKKKGFFKVAVATSSVISLLLVAALISPFFFNLADQVKDQTIPKTPAYQLARPGSRSIENLKKDTYSHERSTKSSSQSKTAPPMLIRSKDLTLEIIDVNKAYSEIDKLVRASSGYVESTNFTRDDAGNATFGYLKVKIPNDKFDETFERTKKLGLVKSINESSEDVTLQYVDNRARLRNLKLQEQRYLALLNRANTINEILAIEEKVSGVREEIEQLQGQIDYLKNATSYVSLAISLQKKTIVKWSFFEHIKQAIQNAADVTGFLLRATGSLIPIILVGILLGYAVKKIRKANRQ